MISNQQYQEAVSVVSAYQQQLADEIEKIAKTLSFNSDTAQVIQFLSNLKSGDKCRIASIKKFLPSVSEGDIMSVLTIEKDYKRYENGQGRFKFKIWLKKEDTQKRLSAPIEITCYDNSGIPDYIYYRVLISYC